MARPHSIYSISIEDRDELSSWLRASNTRRSLAQRAEILLLSDEGMDVETIAERLGCTTGTVYKWRKRYKADGVDGLHDRSRPGQPTKITSETVEWVLKATTERVPKEATHWSVRLMAKYAGITPWQVQQIWKSADLKPHRLKTFKISNDPQFAEKVVDVVGLYMDPPDNALVLSVDEKTQIQALDRTQPMLPLRPGQIEKRTHDYKRHGTASLYAAFDIATGEVIGRVTKRHRAKEFLDFLRQINSQTPNHLDLHLILDNASTHKTPEVQRWLEKYPRFKLHFTPTSASWLNAVEGWFGQLERRALYRGVFTSVENLREEIRRYIKAHNQETAKPFQWTKRAEVIINAVNRAKKVGNAN